MKEKFIGLSKSTYSRLRGRPCSVESVVRWNHNIVTNVKKSCVKIPKPTWSIESLTTDDNSYIMPEEEMQLLAKRCLIRIDDDDSKLRSGLNGIMSLVSKVKALSDKFEATPEEMYDSNGRNEALLRSSTLSDAARQENEAVLQSVKHKMTKSNDQLFFGAVTK